MNKEITIKLGAFLKIQRKSRKYSIKKVALATDIHPGAITKFEVGKTDMTTSRMLQLVRFYNCLTDFEIFLRANLI